MSERHLSNLCFRFRSLTHVGSLGVKTVGSVGKGVGKGVLHGAGAAAMGAAHGVGAAGNVVRGRRATLNGASSATASPRPGSVADDEFVGDLLIRVRGISDLQGPHIDDHIKPYVSLQLNKQQHRSKISHKTSSPEWFDFELLLIVTTDELQERDVFVENKHQT